MRLFNIKMKNGDTIYINEPQYGMLRKILSQKFSVRPDFYFPDDDTTIRIDFIATVLPDKDYLNLF